MRASHHPCLVVVLLLCVQTFRLTSSFYLHYSYERARAGSSSLPYHPLPSTSVCMSSGGGAGCQSAHATHPCRNALAPAWRMFAKRENKRLCFLASWHDGLVCRLGLREEGKQAERTFGKGRQQSIIGIQDTSTASAGTSAAKHANDDDCIYPFLKNLLLKWCLKQRGGDLAGRRPLCLLVALSHRHSVKCLKLSFKSDFAYVDGKMVRIAAHVSSLAHAFLGPRCHVVTRRGDSGRRICLPFLLCSLPPRAMRSLFQGQQ